MQLLREAVQTNPHRPPEGRSWTRRIKAGEGMSNVQLARRPTGSRVTQKIAVYPYHLRQRARVGFSDHFRRLHNEPLVEFVNELETGAAWPRWGHE